MQPTPTSPVPAGPAILDAAPDGMAARVAGSGPPVVLVHGIPGAGRVWGAVADALAADHRVVVPDLLGFGDSPRPRGIDDLWADAQARALARLLDARGIERATLVGHDFGGPVALALAGQRPELVAALALCATNAFPDTPVPLPISAVRWPLAGRVAERVLFSGPALRAMVGRGAGENARLDAGLVVGDGGECRSIRTLFAAALRELPERYAPLERTLRSLRVPALVAWGDRDPFFGVAQAERTARAARARLAVYRGCGHFVPLERPAELERDVRALVEQVERART